MNPTDSPSGPARRHRARIGRVIIRLCVAACVTVAAVMVLQRYGSAFLVAPSVGVLSGLGYLGVTREPRASRDAAAARYFDALHELCLVNARDCTSGSPDGGALQREMAAAVAAARREVPWFHRRPVERVVFLHFIRTAS